MNDFEFKINEKFILKYNNINVLASIRNFNELFFQNYF